MSESYLQTHSGPDPSVRPVPVTVISLRTRPWYSVAVPVQRHLLTRSRYQCVRCGIVVYPVELSPVNYIEVTEVFSVPKTSFTLLVTRPLFYARLPQPTRAECSSQPMDSQWTDSEDYSDVHVSG